jgi:hypothetical protein
MSVMNDQRFFDLAMKSIASQANEGERAELDAMLASQPDCRAKFDRIREDARLAREVLPLLAATESSAGELPEYARGRLRTKVRETLGAPVPPVRPKARGWRWVVGLSTAAVLGLVVLFALFGPSAKPVVEVAMLDLAGPSRGTDPNDSAALHRAWPGAAVQSFASPTDLENWERAWPQSERRAIAKIIYDRSAGEVRVIGRSKGKSFRRTIAVDQKLEDALLQAQRFVREQTSN